VGLGSKLAPIFCRRSGILGSGALTRYSLSREIKFPQGVGTRLSGAGVSVGGVSRMTLMQHLCLDQLCPPPLQLSPLACRTDSNVAHVTTGLGAVPRAGLAIDLSEQ
jgi:hypothetical protein